MLLFALFMAYYFNGSFPFVCLFAGICLASFFLIYRPPNMFFIPELWEKRRMELRELDEPALCALTFLKSGKTKKIVLTISVVLTIVVLLVWYLSNLILPKPVHTQEQENLETMVGAPLAFGLFFALFTFGFQLGILCRYTLKHWDRIQREYEPWPVDKPFNRSLKFWSGHRRP